MTDVAPSAPRQLLPRAERRAAILKAAASAFVHRGFAATSMEDVATEAGITRLIVYRHFSSKEALYEAVLQQVTDRLVDEFLSRLRRATGEGGVGIRALLTVAREDPDGFVLLWRHAAREPQFAEHAARFRDRAVAVTESMLAGRGLADDVHRRWAAELVVSWLVDAVIHWLEQGNADRDEELVALVTAALPAMVTSWRTPGRPSPTRS